MAIETVEQLKAWFRTGLKPTEEQFASLLDSYVHKKGSIGMDKVDGLAESLGGKYDAVAGRAMEKLQTRLSGDMDRIKQRVEVLEEMASIVAQTPNEMTGLAQEANKGKLVYLSNGGVDIYVFTNPDGAEYGRCYALASEVESGDDFALWADRGLTTAFRNADGERALGYIDESGGVWLYYGDREAAVMYGYDERDNVRYEKGLYVVVGEQAVEPILTEADADRWNANAGEDVDLSPYAKKTMIVPLENVASAVAENVAELTAYARASNAGKAVYLKEGGVEVYVFTNPDGEAYGRCYAQASEVESGDDFALWADRVLSEPYENAGGVQAMGYMDESGGVWIYYGNREAAVMYGYDEEDNVSWEKGLYVVVGDDELATVITEAEREKWNSFTAEAVDMSQYVKKTDIEGLESVASQSVATPNELTGLAQEANKGKLVYLSKGGVDIYVFTNPDGAEYGRCYALASEVESGDDFTLWADRGLTTAFRNADGESALGYMDESGGVWIYHGDREAAVMYGYDERDNVRYEKGLYVVAGDGAVESVITDGERATNRANAKELENHAITYVNRITMGKGYDGETGEMKDVNPGDGQRSFVTNRFASLGRFRLKVSMTAGENGGVLRAHAWKGTGEYNGNVSVEVSQEAAGDYEWSLRPSEGESMYALEIVSDDVSADDVSVEVLYTYAQQEDLSGFVTEERVNEIVNAAIVTALNTEV